MCRFVFCLYVLAVLGQLSTCQDRCNSYENHRNFHLLPKLNQCGKAPKFNGRGQFPVKIMGGQGVKLGELPWMALLVVTDVHSSYSYNLCGGSIINSKYVLTAAHCLHSNDGVPNKRLIAVLGENNQRTPVDCDLRGNCAPKPQIIPVEKEISYPGYPELGYANDIGLVRLSRQIEFNDYVQPICLPYDCPDFNQYLVGKSVLVAGWGYLKNGGGYTQRIPSYKLQKLNLKVATMTSCLREWSQYHFISNNTYICAGGSQVGMMDKDVCGGDSGSPLMWVEQNGGFKRFFQVGLVSMGDTCDPKATYRRSGVYSRVANYGLWILDTIRP